MTSLTPSCSPSGLMHYQSNDRDHRMINFANFNQDFSCISVGFEDGYRVYNCEPFSCCYEHKDSPIGIVEMLFCSSLLAIVGSGQDPNMSPRRLKVVNSKRNTTICELTFQTTILAIKMNRDSLIVVLEETIYIYDITGMRLLHTIETPSNPMGLVALSSNIRNNYLAYPCPQKLLTNLDNGESISEDPHSKQSIRNGDIIIFDCSTLHPISVIEAHKTQVAAMVFSNDGTLLATASDKGTIVRIFSVETGVKLYQFRRGTYNTKIYSLAFSPDNMFVIASSATETVHIFRLGEEEAKNTIIKSSGWLSGKPNASERDIEIARQQELNKIVMNRENKRIYGDSEGDVDERGEEVENGQIVHEVENDDEGFDLHATDSEDDGLEFDNVEDDDILGPLPSDKQATNSIFSNGSTGSNGSGNKVEPVVDKKRRSMARLLRRTSQSIGRQAAERMGVYLPPRFSSLLEPNRHFASLKVPISKETPTVVGFMHESATSDIASLGSQRGNLVHILVVSAEGSLYTYALDTERGGDCVLVTERSLIA